MINLGNLNNHVHVKNENVDLNNKWLINVMDMGMEDDVPLQE